MLTEKTLSNYLYRSESARMFDQMASELYQIPGYTLMQRAGEEIANLISYHWPTALEIIIFCGSGKNGGDGLISARLLKTRGLNPIVYLLCDPTELQGDVQLAYQAAKTANIEVHHGSDLIFDQAVYDKILHADLLIDGMIGTGLTQAPLSDLYGAAVQAMNHSGKPVLAIDIPTGLDPNTGMPIHNQAVRATATITFIAKKVGLLIGRGLDYSGQVYFSRLGVPFVIYEHANPTAEVLSYRSERSGVLRPRDHATHKYHYGHLAVIGGNRGYGGAVELCGIGALRVGTGLVTLGTHSQHAANLFSFRPELMVVGIDTSLISQLLELLARVSVIVLGPGLGRDAWGETVFLETLKTKLPMVVDADGLYWLAELSARATSEQTELLYRANWILTPHVGEAAKLLGLSIESIELDRMMAAKLIQEKFGGTVVLKGAGSLICHAGEAPEGSTEPTHKLWVCTAGNPGMAVGGMGDLLSGVIAGLIAQGVSLPEAAKYGVWVHATAGDRAALEGGQRGLLAGDLLGELRRLVG